MIKSNQNVQFDPAKFTWLGSSASFVNDAYLLMLRRDAKVKTVEDARRAGGPPIILGSTAEGASSDAIGILLREWLGFNVKRVVRKLAAWYVEPRWNAQHEIDAELARFASTSSAAIQRLEHEVAHLHEWNMRLQRELVEMRREESRGTG